MTSAFPTRLGLLALALGLTAAACSSDAVPAAIPSTTEAAPPTSATAPDEGGCSITGSSLVSPGPFRDVRLQVFEPGGPDAGWTIDLGAQFLRDHVVTGGVVYGTLRSGPIFALDAATCDEIWSSPQIFPAVSLLVDGTNLFTIDEVSVGAIRLGDGRQVWRELIDLEPGEVVQAQNLGLSGGTVMVVTSGARTTVRGFDALEGSFRFAVDLGPATDVRGLAGDEESVFVTTADRLQRRSLADGSLLWSVDLASAPQHDTAVGGGMAVVVGEDEVLALAITDGSKLWSAPLEADASGPPAIVGDGRVVIIGADGVLRDHGPDARPGTVSFPACCTTPLIEQGRILVNRAGTTAAFDLEGEEVWRRLTGGNDSERFTRIAEDARFVAIVIWSTPAAR